MSASSIGHLTGVQLPHGIHLIDVRLGQECSSHRTYISQTCILDRRATLTGHTLTGHVSYGRSDFGANGQVDINCPYCPPQTAVVIHLHPASGIVQEAQLGAYRPGGTSAVAFS